jgi:acetyl esterase/lipase
MGSSAGGNLAAMLALTRPSDGLEPGGSYAEFSSSVKCAADFYGAVGLLNYHDVKMFAKTREEAPEIYRNASPAGYGLPLGGVLATENAVIPYAVGVDIACA